MSYNNLPQVNYPVFQNIQQNPVLQYNQAQTPVFNTSIPSNFQVADTNMQPSNSTMTGVQNNLPLQNTKITNSVFNTTSQASSLEKTPMADTVELSNKKGVDKKKLGKGIAIGLGIVAVAAGAILLKKKNDSKKLTQLAENIEFKAAESLDDAIKFGKEHLGIKNYEGFKEANLDVVNWVNEGLVRTTNAAKGKVLMPKVVSYQSLGETTLAAATRDKKYLKVNSDIFNNIDDKINTGIEACFKNGIFKTAENGKTALSKILEDANGTILKDFEKYKSGKMSFNEKIGFFNTTSSLAHEAINFTACPLSTLKRTGLASEEVLKKLEKEPFEKQQQFLMDKLKPYVQKGKFKIRVESKSPFSTIYHEMGHIQDKFVATRCPTICDFKKESEYPKALKEWLSNVKDIDTAQSVSIYAATGPGEFIAETYAKMVEGKKLSDDVMTLYKKLGGPMI